jgi:hypothetical protein
MIGMFNALLEVAKAEGLPRHRRRFSKATAGRQRISVGREFIRANAVIVDRDRVSHGGHGATEGFFPVDQAFDAGTGNRLERC